MLGRKQEINLQFNQILDAILIAVAFWLAHTIRFHGHEAIFAPLGRPEIPPIGEHLWLLAITAPFTPVILEFQGFYQTPLRKPFHRSVRQLLGALLWMGLAVGFCVVFFQWNPGSHFFLPMFAVIAGVFVLFKEAIVRSYLRRKIRNEDLRERVILAGSGEALARFHGSLNEEQRSLVQVVGKIDLTSEPVDSLVTAMHETSADRVVFSTGHVYMDKIERAIQACELEGVEAWLAADFIQTSIARPSFDSFGGRPMLVFRCTPDVSWALLAKEVFDRVGAALLILATSPLWLAAYIGIKLSSPGPAMFRQMRSGRNGRPFSMLKFRTMDPDAEQRRNELEEQNEMSGPVFKVDRDPRIFPFGSLLRRLSIDELPQLLNVLGGQMSLVGPRPLPVYEIEKIENSAQRRRLSVKPGLTCLWQVSGRNRITDFDEWVELDLKYIDNWSIWLDIQILLRTIPAVLLGSGAR